MLLFQRLSPHKTKQMVDQKERAILKESKPSTTFYNITGIPGFFVLREWDAY